jgi:hypothetical protein
MLELNKLCEFIIRFTKKIYTYIQTTKLKTKIDYGKN